MSVQNTQQSMQTWAQAYVESTRSRAQDVRRRVELTNDLHPRNIAPTATSGTGYERDWFDGVTLDRPLAIVPTFLTNIVESLTGKRDERTGRALSQVGLAGYQFAQAGMHHIARGQGIVAASSSVLGKVLPTLGVTAGLMQVWKGWSELTDTSAGPISILGSRTARSGILNVVAGALAFVPGVGTAVGGALTRLVAAANEMDMFSFLDAPTVALEEQDEQTARRVHILDRTPTNPYDRDR